MTDAHLALVSGVRRQLQSIATFPMPPSSQIEMVCKTRNLWARKDVRDADAGIPQTSMKLRSKCGCLQDMPDMSLDIIAEASWSLRHEYSGDD